MCAGGTDGVPVVGSDLKNQAARGSVIRCQSHKSISTVHMLYSVPPKGIAHVHECTHTHTIQVSAAIIARKHLFSLLLQRG